jgi:phage shock protein C
MTTDTTAPAPPPEARSEGAAPRRLHRSRTNRVLAGVCGGIAEYYGSDPTAVRLAALIIGLFTGVVPMLVAYIVAAIMVPEREGAAASGDRVDAVPGQTAIVLGALLVLIGIAGFASVWLHVDWDRVWPFALIGLGAVIVVATLGRDADR